MARHRFYDTGSSQVVANKAHTHHLLSPERNCHRCLRPARLLYPSRLDVFQNPLLPRPDRQRVLRGGESETCFPTVTTSDTVTVCMVPYYLFLTVAESAYPDPRTGNDHTASASSYGGQRAQRTDTASGNLVGLEIASVGCERACAVSIAREGRQRKRQPERESTEQ